MKNIRKISLIIMLFTLYKADGLLGSSAGADTVQTIEQRGLTGDEEELFDAVRTGNQEIFENLYKKVVDLNVQDNDGLTLLSQASLVASANMVQMLLRAGANPNIQNNEGWTPLMFVCFMSFESIAKMLLDVSADPNIQDTKGITALMDACLASGDNIHTVKMLLCAGADLSIKSSYGETALDYCDDDVLRAYLLARNRS